MDLMARRRAIMGMPSGKDYTVSGNVVSISNALAKNAKSAIVTFLPKQSGSGDPSPSNVRPISGYNDISVVRYGKNLLFCDQSTATIHGVTTTRNADGSFSLSGTATANGNLTLNAYEYLSDFGFFKAGETYVLSGGTSANMALIFGVYGSGTDYRDNGTGRTMSFTAEQIATLRYRLLLTITNGTNYDGVKVYPQIQYGSTATTFEPYISPVTANVHSDTTLFGGTVDLVSGVCQLNGMLETFITDDGNAIVSQLNSFSKQSTGVGTIGSYTRISFAVRGDVDQTQFNRLSNTYATPFCNYAKHYFAYNNESTHWYRNGTMYLFLPTSLVGSTGQSVYDYLVSIMNTEPLSMWVELATPITYHLTPSQLALLKGNNTVYSNEGSISLTYVGK